MTAAILGMGTALPPHALPQSETARLAADYCAVSSREKKLLPELYRRTHVDQRGSVLIEPRRDEPLDAASVRWFYRPPAPGDHNGESSPSTAERMAQYRRSAPDLAARAAADALRTARISADRITHLVLVTCTGFASPGVEFQLIQRLGLPRTVRRAQVGFMGCHGALNGLGVAKAFADAEPDAHVLLCSVELCSLHFQYGFEPQRIVANALFADGAAAAIIGPAGDDPATWSVRACGSCLLPDSAEDMTWHVGDHGFEMTLSPRVPDLIAGSIRPWLDEFLAGHGLNVEAVGSWAVHAGGPRIVAAVAERLELPQEAVETSRAVLRECGNMSSATLLFILDRLRHGGAALPCVMLGFGPGLTAEAVLLT